MKSLTLECTEDLSIETIIDAENNRSASKVRDRRLWLTDCTWFYFTAVISTVWSHDKSKLVHNILYNWHDFDMYIFMHVYM